MRGGGGGVEKELLFFKELVVFIKSKVKSKKYFKLILNSNLKSKLGPNNLKELNFF